MKTTWLVKKVNANFQLNSANFTLPVFVYEEVHNLIMKIKW